MNALTSYFLSTLLVTSKNALLSRLSLMFTRLALNYVNNVQNYTILKTLRFFPLFFVGSFIKKVSTWNMSRLLVIISAPHPSHPSPPHTQWVTLHISCLGYKQPKKQTNKPHSNLFVDCEGEMFHDTSCPLLRLCCH